MNRREFIAKGPIAAGAAVCIGADGTARSTRFERLRGENRVRIIRIPPDALEPILDGSARGPQFMSLMVWKNLPVGCIVDRIYYDFFSHSFAAAIYHEDFSPVTPGAEIPLLPGWDFSTENVVYEKISDHYRPTNQ